MQRFLVPRRWGAARIVLGTLFDLLACESQAERSLAPAHRSNPARKHEYPPAVQPVARLDDEITNGPRRFVKQKVREVADQVIRGLYAIAVYHSATS